MPRSPAQRAASAKFFAKHQPATDLGGVGEEKVLPELVGKRLFFEPLGLTLEYLYSFRSKIDGQVYHIGTLVAQGPGTQFRLGCEWSCQGRKLRIDGKCNVEERRTGAGQEVEWSEAVSNCPWSLSE